MWFIGYWVSGLGNKPGGNMENGAARKKSQEEGPHGRTVWRGPAIGLLRPVPGSTVLVGHEVLLVSASGKKRVMHQKEHR